MMPMDPRRRMQPQMLGMQPMRPPQQQPPTGLPPMQGMGQGMPQQMLGQGMQQPPPQIDPRTWQMIRPMQQQQQGVESPLPADPMQRLRMELLQDKAAEARNREMLERSIQQKKVRDLVGQTGIEKRSTAMLDPRSVMRESEMDPRSVVRAQEMFEEMEMTPDENYQNIYKRRGGPRVGAEEMFRRMR